MCSNSSFALPCNAGILLGDPDKLALLPYNFACVAHELEKLKHPRRCKYVLVLSASI